MVPILHWIVPTSHIMVLISYIYFFLVKRKYINYELIKRKRVAFETSKANASSTCAGALEKERKSEDWTQPAFARTSTQPFASLNMCLREQSSNFSIMDLQSVTMALKKILGVVMELTSSTATKESISISRLRIPKING